MKTWFCHYTNKYLLIAIGFWCCKFVKTKAIIEITSSFFAGKILTPQAVQQKCSVFPSIHIIGCSPLSHTGYLAHGRGVVGSSEVGSSVVVTSSEVTMTSCSVGQLHSGIGGHVAVAVQPGKKGHTKMNSFYSYAEWFYDHFIYDYTIVNIETQMANSC